MAEDDGFEEVSDYRFRPADLNIGSRRPGISAFMRIRNGADFLEGTIRSHIARFDEIVAVYNRTTDATPDILARLRAEFGPKLRVFHYLPPVFPPGSTGHASEPADSPRSMVNYSNFALAQTRYTVVAKLDDDHLAREEELATVTRDVRSGAVAVGEMLCFSGINLARDEAGHLGVPVHAPFSGQGDIGFLRLGAETYFAHDRRFERFQRGGLRRRFGGVLYWHLKYLKAGFGFAHVDIETGTNLRMAGRKERFLANRRVVPISALPAMAPRGLALLSALPLPDRQRLVIDRWRALKERPISEAEFAAVRARLGSPS